jgi:hypothetical protein
MPASWPAGECWEPDKVFAQIQAGLLNAESIGWLPTKAHLASAKEAAKNNWRQGTLVVEEWLLIEYGKLSVDFSATLAHNQGMETNDIPPEILAQMHVAALKAMSPDRDPEAMKNACERMDRMREDIKKKHGILDIGVPAIRELRDE